MKNTIVKIILGLTIGCFVSNAQDSNVKKANDRFENYQYAEAINLYEDLVKLGYSDLNIYTKLANSNYLNARYKNAAEWYQKLFTLENATIDTEEMYKYAVTLKSLKKYKESDVWMQKFAKAKQADHRANLFVSNKGYLKKIKESSKRYTIKNIAVNSVGSDFSPSFYGNKLVYSSTRDTGIVVSNIDEWSNKSFLNLYEATVSENGELSNSKPLSKKLNKKTHESSPAFTKDGKTLYFTRNNSSNGRFVRDNEGVSRLKLYKAQKVNGEWRNITELPFNNDTYSIAHPTLNPEENKLYFASDMPGTFGKSDIFVVDINEDGTYSTPKNMGAKINTESRETFPYVTEENVLYFSSDGHPGLGGLDIFATSLEDEDDLYIQNIGEPINSNEDDFSFIFNTKTKKGYFASNRDSGKGNDDIYSFVENTALNHKCSTAISGNIIDEKTGISLTNVNITINDNNGDLISETITDAKGHFSLEGSCKNGAYKLLAQKTEYNNGDNTFSVVNNSDTKGIIVKLVPIKKAAPIGTDLTKYLNLDPIYFDLDKSFIRIDGQITMQKVMAYLKEFPNAAIEIRSHTDTRATNTYNLALSNKRAKETVKYLTDNDISISRLSGKGYGESQLTNECNTASKCNETKHQQNRRSEFIIVK